MKRLLFFIIILSVSSVIKAQTLTNPVVKLEVLQAKNDVHDFGEIPQGNPVYYSFEFINVGKTAIKFDNVTATCGCTTPEWSRDEIAPGAKTSIKVGYNAGVHGPFEKYVNITFNGTETKQLTIKGNVWKTPDGSAPENASVIFLKKLNN